MIIHNRSTTKANLIRYLCSGKLFSIQSLIANFELKGKVLQHMDTSEIEKEKSHIIVEIIQYIPNAVQQLARQKRCGLEHLQHRNH
jgi:hypothetical protein